MNEQDKKRVEARLAERAEELERNRGAVRSEGEGMIENELAHVDNHPADEGTETYEQEMEVSAQVYLDEEEQRIAEARRALADGTYGTCVDCGTEIPAERLEAVPEAVRCVDCQRLFEGERRQRQPDERA